MGSMGSIGIDRDRGAALDDRPPARHRQRGTEKEGAMLGVRTTTSRCVPGRLRQSQRVVGRERRNARVKTAATTTTAGVDAIPRGGARTFIVFVYFIPLLFGDANRANASFAMDEDVEH